ncbi:MAG: hypothetical protein WD176_06765 [Pirellulales bacterium]
MRRSKLMVCCLAWGLIAIYCATAVAADDKPSPTGTWKSTSQRGGQTVETTLKLKLDGEKLTGSIKRGDGQEREIEEGKYKDGAISFQVTRERDGQKRTVKYTGKVDKDAITGKVEFGENRSADWKAERVKE